MLRGQEVRREKCEKWIERKRDGERERERKIERARKEQKMKEGKARK